MFSELNDGLLHDLGTREHVLADAMARARAETLALYDIVKASGPTDYFRDKLAQIEQQVQSGIAESSVSDAALLTLLRVMPFWTTDIRVGRSATYAAILQYGVALTDDGEWEAAREVFMLVAGDAERDYDLKMAARCLHRAGQAYRMCAEWDNSEACCSRAIALAVKVGDIFTAFRCQMNQASMMRDRGDLSGAKRQLQAVIRSARYDCPDVVIIATGALATVAHAAGRPERAIALLRQVMELAKDDQRTRTKALVDIANCLTDCGLPTVANEALQIVVATAPERYVRTIALLNLFSLASNDHDVDRLDWLRERLLNSQLTLKQQTEFALFEARALRNEGHFDHARQALTGARELAERHKFFQVSFQIDGESRLLDDAIAGNPSVASVCKQVEDYSAEVRRTVDVIHSLSNSLHRESEYADRFAI